MRTNPRGTALLTVLIVLLAISLLGAGVIVVSGRHLSHAKARETAVGLSNCAMAVRQYVAANLSPGATTVPNFSIPSIQLVGGEYDNLNLGQDAQHPTVIRLSSLGAIGGGGGAGIQNLANAMPMTISAGSSQIGGTAVCIDSNNRTYEVEFSFVR